VVFTGDRGECACGTWRLGGIELNLDTILAMGTREVDAQRVGQELRNMAADSSWHGCQQTVYF